MVILKQKMKVGPKGQVVIPKLFREAANIYPGNEVFVEMADHQILIEKQESQNIIEAIRRIAKAGKSVKKIDSDKDYEEMLEERWKRIEKSI